MALTSSNKWPLRCISLSFHSRLSLALPLLVSKHAVLIAALLRVVIPQTEMLACDDLTLFNAQSFDTDADPLIGLTWNLGTRIRISKLALRSLRSWLRAKQKVWSESVFIRQSNSRLVQ